MGFQLPNQLYSGPKLMSNDWIRPTDWPTITNADKEVNFLVSDKLNLTIKIQTAFSITATENLYIDWGDGSGISTITTNTSTITPHTYTAGTGTPCSLGYTTFVIRVWTDSGASITDCRIFSTTTADIVGSKFIAVPVLEAYYGNDLQIIFTSYFASCQIDNNVQRIATGGVANYSFLEYVKLPEIFGATMTDLNYTFQYCTNIKKIDLPKSILGTSLTLLRTFEYCTELRGLIIPYVDYLGLGQFLNCGQNATFQQCYMLKYIHQYDANGAVSEDLLGFYSCATAFAGSNQLASISIDVSLMRTDVPYYGSLANMFAMLQGLQRVNIIGWPKQSVNAGGQSMNGMFNGCSQLETVTFSNSASEGLLGGAPVNAMQLTQMFNNCVSLKGVITFPRGIYNGTTTTGIPFDSTFNGCTSLIGVDLEPIAMSGITNMSSMFASCINLNSDFLSLPVPIGTNFGMNNAFLNCYSLKKFDFTSSGISGAFEKATTLQGAFNRCDSLLEVTLPTTLDVCANISSMFLNCMNLEYVTFPASMPALTNITGAFQRCYSLKSGILPTSLNTSATISFNSIYQQCYSLQSVTLPTVAIQGQMFGTFIDCRELKYIDISNTAINNNFNQTFQGCTQLETVVLPPLLRTLTNGISMFQTCSNLKNIVNFSGLGSTTANMDFSKNDNMSLLPGLTFSCRLSKIEVNGAGVNELSALSYLRFQSTSTGQWSSTTPPQINISYTNMSTAALVNTFTDIAATGTYTGKVINITGCSGAAGLTSADRLIITSKGWTITG